MFNRLELIEKRYNDINEMLQDPSVTCNVKKTTELMKELRSLGKIVDVYHEYQKVVKSIQDLKELTKELNIKDTQINAVLKLLSQGATIPFIARYRKEVTGNLNEDEDNYYVPSRKEVKLSRKKKKEFVRKAAMAAGLIDEKGMPIGLKKGRGGR